MPAALSPPDEAKHLPVKGSPGTPYDVAVVGAGPVGSFHALTQARQGARVALLEANPKASRRLAGEWLHPVAVRMLQDAGIHLETEPRSNPGKGFVLFPEDGSAPIVLPYPGGWHGRTCEHAAVVSKLREAIEGESGVDFIAPARVRDVEDGRVVYARDGRETSLEANRIVGADGRASVVRRSLGLPTSPVTCSRMVGFLLPGQLPLEDYGHVLLGGPGQILMYRIDEHWVRVILDVPLDLWTPKDRVGLLCDSYASRLPETFKAPFVDAVRSRQFHAAANEVRPRITYGTPNRVLIGDAAGHYHPMTAVGMTLGFGDGLALAQSDDFDDFVTRRSKATRAAELLAIGLYDVFADHRPESAEVRQAVYAAWRTNMALRDRTMRLLAGEDMSTASLSVTFFMIVARALSRLIPSRRSRHGWHSARDVVRALAVRLVWVLRGLWELRRARGASKNMGEAAPATTGERPGVERDKHARDKLARGFPISMSSTGEAPRRDEAGSVDAGPAFRRAEERLLAMQGEDGGWEGEMTWCPMLTAQFVLLHHVVGRPLEVGRRRRVLRFFEQTRHEDGGWGLHDHSPPYLFVTTLVYVAARLAGVAPDDPLVAPARRFLQAEGVVNIPSWGKFWLAILNLYEWRGVNPILPELWRLPLRFPLHPSNWYCHTRLIYMAMAAVYSRKYQTPVTPLIAALREELYPAGFANTNFAAGRKRLRPGDLYAPPGIALRCGYTLMRLYDTLHGKRLRERCTDEIAGQIRWELQASAHTSISPVSGLLNILALWLRDPNDADANKALGKLDDWIWEDEDAGARVTGARSASWDTGFALQALAAAPKSTRVHDAMRRGAGFLREQQIRTSFDGFDQAFRNDPEGGWCFAGGWHGWPVTDCTAEAVLGLLAADDAASAGPDAVAASAVADRAALRDAVRFMLRGQCRDGGFGSYEAQRSRLDLEWLNPAEMFADSMTEHSFVECTASCLAALAACRARHPEVVDQAATDAISRADTWLRRAQGSDGSWRGVWGVQFVYGTLFGIRGLLAGGARPGDPALRLACKWLIERQRPDGGWGEHHSGCVSGRYVPHTESQVIQTAWALMALLEAKDPTWTAISRGVAFLIDAQDADGGWPRQDMAGVFFRTALLDYALYRQYFPLHALGLYEQRRRLRHDLATPPLASIDARAAS